MTTTKKQTNTSKVRNMKGISNFKTGKNQQAESLIRRSFEPLFSPRDGKARLTFCGVEHSFNNENKKIDGEIKIVQVPKLVLVFSCLDITHEAPQNIGVRVNYNLSKTNALGRFLILLGYQFNDITEVINNDDEDFGIKVKTENPKEIFDFLRQHCGLVFKAELKRATAVNKKGEIYEKGLWNIDTRTIEPKFLKTGEQERDMLASDISDEDFENPDIAIESDAD